MHLLLLFLATIVTVRSECGQDEVFKSCGTHCEASCLDLEPLCKTDCLEDVCQCDKGFVRHEGKCIFPTFCPKTCKINEELLQCGTACEPSCADPDPMICTKQCLVNVCQCKSGFVRNQEGECVELSKCSATFPTPKSVEEK